LDVDGTSNVAFDIGSKIEWSFYMPKEATTAPTSSDGDRLDMGDKVYMLGAPVDSSGTWGASAFTENCGNGELLLGA
jgi:hypothetical protein